jgi:hypothetical protein
VRDFGESRRRPFPRDFIHRRLKYATWVGTLKAVSWLPLNPYRRFQHDPNDAVKRHRAHPPSRQPSFVEGGKN